MTKMPLNFVSFAFLFAFLAVQQSLCADPLQTSPAPSPESGTDADVGVILLPPAYMASPSPSPSPSPLSSSPPSPPAADLAPETSPSPAPSPASGDRSRKYPSPSPSPAPSRDVAADVNHESNAGLKGGQKAGIALGVIAGVFVVGLGAKVYKKRQQNIRRAQFGNAARREFL